MFKKIKIIILFIIFISIVIFTNHLTNNKNIALAKFFEKNFSPFFTSEFKIEKIEITGIQNIKESSILNTLNIKKGSSIYQVDLNDIYKKIKNINFVSKVNIERKFNNNLKINVIEKNPIGILQRNNEYKIITSDGSLIYEKEIYKFDHLPIFIGENVEKKANKILSLLNEIDFLKMIWSVTLVNERRWNLNLKNGITILLPEKQYSASLKKINELNKKYNFLESNLVEIDLRDKKKIIFQPLLKPLNVAEN
tara:strand:- start:1 stop:756 length:756 start_codon:yes stop_codon:yes gene_type:complete